MKREYAKMLTVLQAYGLIAAGVRIICTNQVPFVIIDIYIYIIYHIKTQDVTDQASGSILPYSGPRRRAQHAIQAICSGPARGFLQCKTSMMKKTLF